MKKVDIVSKIVGRDGEGTRAPSPSAASASVDLSGYLKKEVWDDVWEVRETEEGTRYVLGKLPMVLRYGMTMYAEDESLNLPGIYDGLPIDGDTIYWEETDSGKVLKAKGGGTGGGSIEYPLSWSGYSSGSYDGSVAKSIYIPSKVSELTNDSSFITSSALNGYATESYVTSRGYITSSALSGYATESWVNGKGYLTSSSLNGYATQSWVTGQGYATSAALGGYLPLTGGTLTGSLWIDGDRAFMPMDTNGYGLYFAGLNINVHKNHAYQAPFIGSDAAGNLQFAKHPTISGSPIATQGWVSGAYLPKSGGTMTGNLWIENTQAYLLSIYRKQNNGGAYVRYLASNQQVYSWAVGSDAGHRFAWYYEDTSQGIDAYKMVLDSSGNLYAYGGITQYSDIRKKTVINHVQLSLKEVADAPLIEHYYNSDERKTTHVGSIAQYWAGLNDWFCKKDDDGYYTMEIQNAALASAISIARELVKYETKTDKQIRKLKKRISELEEEIEKLKTA